jgi:hypothetical protein
MSITWFKGLIWRGPISCHCRKDSEGTEEAQRAGSRCRELDQAVRLSKPKR